MVERLIKNEEGKWEIKAGNWEIKGRESEAKGWEPENLKSRCIESKCVQWALSTPLWRGSKDWMINYIIKIWIDNLILMAF